MNFIKKHKEVSILLIIVFLIVLFGGILFAIMWFSGSGDEYGDRLDGIEQVELSNGYLNDIVDAIKAEKEYVSKVTFILEGRLVSFLVTVADETDVDSTKSISSIIIDHFTKEELEYYDLQLYILDSLTDDTDDETEENKSRYPIIGYKHKTSEQFVWSNN